MSKASEPIEEVNALLFDDETQEFTGENSNFNTQKHETQKSEPRLLSKSAEKFISM